MKDSYNILLSIILAGAMGLKNRLLLNKLWVSQHNSLKKQMLLFVIFSCGGLVSIAQEAFPVTGGDASGTEGSLSYTVGQSIYITLQGIDGSSDEGVQQAYEVSVIPVSGNHDIFIDVFPNPAKDIIWIEAHTSGSPELSCILGNMEGKFITRQKLENNSTSISLEELPSAIYFLKVMNGNELVKMIKITKY